MCGQRADSALATVHTVINFNYPMTSRTELWRGTNLQVQSKPLVCGL